MLFNSAEFLLFLPIVFILYWFVLNKNLKSQNFLLLVASYVFYGWWDYRFLSLIIFSTFVDYYVGLKIEAGETKKLKRTWLTVSMIVNLGLLGFFKYYNFFVDSFVDAFASMGYHMDPWTLNIILPVGISFYTFQTMSYSLDIYRKDLKPTKDFIAFAAFVSFFPQLVAGPIERASKLLPQITSKRKFDFNESVIGLRLILLGMFKKVIIADSLAPFVNDIFENYTQFAGGTLILGAIYFSIQIYGDFSGYSDIAIGLSKLFGIDLMTNFKFPYFSRSIGEFWRRWHISLSTWFRDYLYIPLGGSRVGKLKSIRNIFIIFLVSGFWHGANWTFVTWGAIHAMLFVPAFIIGANRNHLDEVFSPKKWYPKPKEVIQISYIFIVVAIAWIFFRAESLSHALDYISNISLKVPEAKRSGIVYVAVLLVVDYLWIVFRLADRKANVYVEGIILALISFIVLTFQFVNTTQEFIYFQF